MPQLTFARMYHHTPIFTAFDNVNGQVLRSQSSCCAIGRAVIIKHSAITCHHTPSPHTLYLSSHPITSHSLPAITPCHLTHFTCHHTLLHHTLYLPSHPITSHTAQGRTEGGVSFGSGSDSFYE
jgi:hypothetical protein